jgi:hypothetical protein
MRGQGGMQVHICGFESVQERSVHCPLEAVGTPAEVQRTLCAESQLDRSSSPSGEALL